VDHGNPFETIESAGRFFQHHEFILSLFLCVASFVSLSAQPATADADYATFQALNKEAPPGSPKDIGAEKYLTWMDGHRQAIRSAALAFQAAPADPQRWDLVMTAVKASPYFIKSFGPDVEAKGPGAIIADEPPSAASRQQNEALTQAMLASTDAAADLQEGTEWGMFCERLPGHLGRQGQRRARRLQRFPGAVRRACRQVCTA